jgi:hypothetical protein
MGQVLTVGGQPVKGARVELWQANTHGRYTHPSDTNPAPLDPNFEGFAGIGSWGAASEAGSLCRGHRAWGRGGRRRRVLVLVILLS